MGLLGQIKSILSSDESPVQKEYFSTRNDRRRRARFSHKGRKILIVDDSATIVASLKKLLRSAGCMTLEAADAETGLAITRENRPDLIFLDIVLPGMNGFAALRQIRRDDRTKDIPVIIISGNEQAIQEFYAKRIGADDFMRKPFSRFDVFSHVETLVRAGKLAKLDTAAEPARRNADGSKPARATPKIPDKPRMPPMTTDNERKERAVLDSMPQTVLEARRQLTAMGLQYFNQEQFLAAMERNDKLAVKLFIIGRGVKLRK